MHRILQLLMNRRKIIYSRIEDVDPHLPPSTPWTGKELHLKFLFLKTKIGFVNDAFCCSGSLDAGADIKEADRFYGHITRLMECGM
jgi:hypothetical protein